MKEEGRMRFESSIRGASERSFGDGDIGMNILNEGFFGDVIVFRSNEAQD